MSDLPLAYGTSLLVGGVAAAQMLLDGGIELGRCQAIDDAAVRLRRPLAGIVGLLCLAPIACCAWLTYVFSRSPRAAVLAAALACAFERSSTSIKDGSLEWPLRGGLVAIATVLIVVAARRGCMWRGAAGGVMLVGAAIAAGQIEFAAVLGLGCGAALLGLLQMRRAPATARMAAGITLGIGAAATIVVWANIRLFDVAFAPSAAEFVRLDLRLQDVTAQSRSPAAHAARLGASVDATRVLAIPPIGDRMRQMLETTGRVYAAHAAGAIVAYASALAETLWRLGGLLALAVLFYAPASYRIARARDLSWCWAGTMTPLVFLAIDNAVGVAQWYGALSVLLPLVVLPAAIWRDL